MSAVQNGPFFQSPVPGAGKTVVIIGSSGAAGMGASGYTGNPGADGMAPPTSWAGMWAAELAADGFTVRNVSISGTGTQASLDRFDSDVAPLRPAYVVLCTNPRNDGWDASPGAITPVHVANTRRLIAKCLAIGAVPVLGFGIYPNNDWTALHVLCARNMLRQFEATGYPTVNLIDPLLDYSTSKLITGFAIDGIHLQDPGQMHLYRAIPVGLLSDISTTSLSVLRGANFSNILAADFATAGPALITLSKPANSWTISLRIKGSASITTGRAFLAITTNADRATAPALRIRNASGTYELVDAVAQLAASAVNPTSDTSVRALTISHQMASGITRWYIDADLIWSGTQSYSATAMEVFSLLGRFSSPANNAAAAGLSGVLLWRCPLSDLQAKNLFWSNRVPVSGLEFAAGDFDCAIAGAIPNQARSSGACVVNAAFTEG